MALFDEVPFFYGKGYDYGTMFGILFCYAMCFLIVICLLVYWLLKKLEEWVRKC